MKFRLLILPALAVVMACNTACKPTEAGYKAAYDVALSKRNSDIADAELYGGMRREGDPVWRAVGNDSLLFIQQPLARLDGDSLPVADVNVAVAVYKMNTNALSHAERLRTEGLDSRVLRGRTGTFLVIAAQLDSLAPAVPFIDKYMRDHPSDMYAGLPGRPVATVPSGRRIR